MTFHKDDVVYDKLGRVGVVIGAGITIEGQIIFICEVPGHGPFTFFLGTEVNLKPFELDGKIIKRARNSVDFDTWLST